MASQYEFDFIDEMAAENNILLQCTLRCKICKREPLTHNRLWCDCGGEIEAIETPYKLSTFWSRYWDEEQKRIESIKPKRIGGILDY